MSSVQEHRAQAPASIACAILTVSDTRTLETDRSGALLLESLSNAGHTILDRRIVPDDPGRLRPVLETWIERDDVQAVLITGGTGISPRDQTFETVSALLTRPLPGYGELFRMLSYAEIGSACMLSRAVGGLARTTAVLLMPGSAAAVRLALEKIILPELPHLIREARKPG